MGKKILRYQIDIYKKIDNSFLMLFSPWGNNSIAYIFAIKSVGNYQFKHPIYHTRFGLDINLVIANELTI